jgi:integrase
MASLFKAKFPTPAEEIGFADARLHSFGHASVSQAILDGASEGEIREWVGHTNSRIVERYRHLRNEDARRKIDKIDFLGGAPAIAKNAAIQGSNSTKE